MFRKAIELDSKHADAHYNLGHLLQFVRKDFDRAEAMYRKAIELDPRPSPSWVHWNLSLDEARANSSDGAELVGRRELALVDARLRRAARDDLEGAIRVDAQYIRKGGLPWYGVKFDGDALLKYCSSRSRPRGAIDRGARWQKLSRSIGELAF